MSESTLNMVELMLWAPRKKTIMVEREDKTAKAAFTFRKEEISYLEVPKVHEEEIGRYLEEVGQYNVVRNRYVFASPEVLDDAIQEVLKRYVI